MSEAMTGAVRPAEQGGAERRFYGRMAMAMVVIVLIGFAPSFYLRPFDLIHYPRPNPELTPGLMIHGITFTLWLLIFIAQVALVSAGRRDLHRALGVAGMVFAIALLPIMYLNSVWMVARGSAPPFTEPLAWTAVPLLAIPAYVVMIALGWRNRQGDLQAHKRYMLGLMIMLMEPAFSRFPILPPTLTGFALLSILGWLLYIPLIRWDRKTIGQMHRATRIGAMLYAAVIALQVLCLAFPGPWKTFAATLPGVGS